MPSSSAPAQHLPDSRYAYMRLLVTMLLLTVGSGGMYVVAVVLPAVQAEFGIDRAQASMPYTALLVGRWRLGTKKIDAPVRTDAREHGERTVRVHRAGKIAISEFRPLAHYRDLATLADVSIRTGRTHQIRVHAAYAGHAVAGDEKYGDRERNAKLRALGLRRMFLHASSVAFRWPDTGEAFRAEAPLPRELAAVLERLGEP